MKNIILYFRLLLLVSITLTLLNCKDKGTNSKSQDFTEYDHNNNTLSHSQDEKNHTHDDHDNIEVYEDQVKIDDVPIYKLGDLFKTQKGVNNTGQMVAYPDKEPIKKLIAFIESVPDDINKFRKDQDHLNAIKSLDSFAKKNPAYKVSVLHFGLPNEEFDIFYDAFYDEMKSQSLSTDLEQLIIHPDAYYTELDVNMGPIYFMIDKDNTVESIFVGSHYSHEFVVTSK